MIDDAPEIFTGVRQLLIGGESLSPSHVRKALATLPDTHIINGYGPTESTTFACCYAIDHLLPEDVRSIPIGHPISNTQVYVLDKNLQPVPIGIPGELYIGGPGLARGYLRRPDITAERFLPHPFSKKIGARLYKTGDLVRYRADSTIEFLGRLDAQVKIRGFRIELGEIDAVVAQHPNTKECATILYKDASGEKRLVTYLVAHEQTEDIVQNINRYLKELLPEYMLPSAVLCIPTLPLTPNGKFDWRSLPPPDRQSMAVRETSVSPRNALETSLAKIWSEVMDIESIGIHDNFFDLGGHSLLAMMLVSHMKKLTQSEISVLDVFMAPTLAALAERVTNVQLAGYDPTELEALLSSMEDRGSP